jgi:hypothetical protein
MLIQSVSGDVTVWRDRRQCRFPDPAAILWHPTALSLRQGTCAHCLVPAVAAVPPAGRALQAHC